ncbi:MAG TPA: hypothetical protein VFW96_23240 [Thermomicrobiales bacterium]|nr:hypothetical protein [Thermomicrobiales bacterium]
MNEDAGGASRTPELAEAVFAGCDLPLSAERRAHLAPRLRALLAGFAPLADLARPATEPAGGPDLAAWEDDDGER